MNISNQFLDALMVGNVPWRYPHNRLPAFEPLFGNYFRGEPVSDPNYSQLDQIIKASGARIIHNWRCRKPRCHRPPRDMIVLPLKEVFMDEKQYQATRLHEVFHYVEQPWRVGWIGSDSQSELVSEVGTGMVESILRLPHDEDTVNITKWLPTWAAAIKADPNYLFDAIAQADRAARYLLDLPTKAAA